MRIKSFSLGALLVAMPAAAQPLGQFLSAADRANYDARTGAEARVKAAADFTAAWGALLPSLTVTGGWTHNQYDAVFQLPGQTDSITIVPKDQLDAQLKVEVPLIDASRWLKTSAASASASAAERKDASTREQVRRAVVSAFYAYLGARAVLESAQRSLALSQAQAEVTAARTGAGVANELELMRARAEVERNQQLVADAEALVANGARTLETLTGLAPRDVPPLPSDGLAALPPLEQYQARGVEGRPAVQAAAEELNAANRTAVAAGLALVPTVNAQFTQRFTNATGFQGQGALYNAGVNLSWRLDVPAVATMRAIQANQETALIAQERARRQVEDQLHGDWQKTKAAVKKVQAARAQVVAARRAASLAQERNAAGVATQLDVIQAERDLFSAELSDIQAAAELASARALLSLSAGEPLEVAP